MMTLEEAGAETIGTVIATVKHGDPSEFSRSVDRLVSLGLVRREEFAGTVELVLTDQGKVALRA
jgi:DNA-binding MarR family transcriptional regulator